MEFIKPDTRIDFMGKLHIALGISAVVVVISLVLMVVPGIQWGIDFRGGTEVQLRFNGPMEVSTIRDALASVELPDDSVQRFGGAESNEFLIKLQSTNFGATDEFNKAQAALEAGFPGKLQGFKLTDDGSELTFKRQGGEPDVAAMAGALKRMGSMDLAPDLIDANIFHVRYGDPSEHIKDLLGQALSADSFEVMRVESVGPKVGAELRTQGVLAVIFTTLLLLIYIAFRFDTEYAPGAIACLLHDVAITLGVLIVSGSEFNLSTVAAILTVVGYSLNDTIVVFDRIRENRQRYRDMDLVKVVNRSINETISRTVLTSFTTFIVVVALFSLGGSIIHDFALALLCGITVGTYSSIYIASPVVILTRRALGEPDDEGEQEGDTSGRPRPMPTI